MVKDDLGGKDAATSSRFLRRNSVKQIWKFKLEKLKLLKMAALFLFTPTLLIFFLEPNLTAGTCECQCWRQNFSCGYSGFNTSTIDCIWIASDAATCTTGSCAGGAWTGFRKTFCAYTW